MIKTPIAALVALSLLAGTSCMAAEPVEGVTESAIARAKAEARWVRAERDRANRILSRDFVRGENPIRDVRAEDGAEENPVAAPEVSNP
jgi:hypothetical protein